MRTNHLSDGRTDTSFDEALSEQTSLMSALWAEEKID